MSMKKDEARMSKRPDVEEAIKEYYRLCQDADYDFEQDIKDIICDATEREVIL
jgi:hypothetical protein